MKDLWVKNYGIMKRSEEIVTLRVRTSCVNIMTNTLFYFYRPQRSWAKVISSQASVCPWGGVVWSLGGLQFFWGVQFFGGSPIFQGVTNFFWGVVSPIFFGGSPIFFSGMHPPPPPYGHWVAGTHPTGMHSC